MKLVPHLDRSDLMHTPRTPCLRNLTDGVLLVTLILFLFLGNVRSALIVTITIPFSLLFAAILLDLRHIPANLLSLGALDFGMVVDGSVVMVENILRHTSLRRQEKILPRNHRYRRPRSAAAGLLCPHHHYRFVPADLHPAASGRPLVQPHGVDRGFRAARCPALRPVHCAGAVQLLFGRDMKEWRNPVLEWLNRSYGRSLDWCFDHMKLTLGMGLVALGAMLFIAISGIIGSEFLPHLDEGAIWVRGTLAPSTGPSTSIDMSKHARLVLADFPKSSKWSARSDVPTMEPTPAASTTPNSLSIFSPAKNGAAEFHDKKDELIAAMDKKLQQFPGVDWNFSQPISDNVEEAVSGVKGELAVKLSARDLKDARAKSRRDSGRHEPDSRRRRPGNVSGARAAQRQSQRSTARRPIVSESTSAIFRMRSKPPLAAKPSARF